MSSARQGLAIVGQIAGSFFGPVGAVVGGFIGGEIGGFIDGPPEGPRLDDTSAPGIEFGAQVPRAYGTAWYTLSPLWWSKLRESSEVVGGKGGDAGQEQFSYRADLLGRLCELPPGREDAVWTRIRIDGEVVATRRADSSVQALNDSATTELWSDVEFFPGTPTQPPWSVMEAAVGSANAIAYRARQGTIGFTDLLFQNGRAPSLIEVEVATLATLATTVVGDGWLCHFDELAVDPDFTVAALGPDAELIAGATVTPDVGVWAGYGHLSGVGEKFLVTGITGSTAASWRFEAVYAGDYQGTLFTLTSILGREFQLQRPNIFGDFLYNIASNVTVGGGTIGSTAAWDAGGINHVALQWRADNGALSLFLNGEYVGGFGLGAHFPNVFNTITIGDATGFIVEAYYHLGVPDIDLYDVAGYAVPTEPFAASDSVAASYTPLPEDLQFVLESEMLASSPLTAAHIDMSAAAGKQVWGYKSTGAAAQSCAPLLAWFYLDLYCADKIVAVERGGAIEQTIAYGYSGAGLDGAGEPFAGLDRGNDVEVPVFTVVQYINVLADGEQDARQSERIGAGNKISQVNFPLYAYPTEAKGRADTITQDNRDAAQRATVRLGAQQGARVQPGSVLAILDNKGNSYRVRVLRLVWDRGVYAADVVQDDPTILRTVGITTEVDARVFEPAAVPEAEFLPLDLPLLREADNDAGYYALVKTENSPVGVRWFDSPDDVTYTARQDYANDAIFGRVTDKTGSFDRRQFFDEASTLTVDIGAGTLASATRDALLNNRSVNAFAVGLHGRLVLGQFRDATLVSAGVYTLSGLLDMGAKGTEPYCSSIALGDRFALLGTAGTARIAGALALLGVAQYVKGVAFGRNRDNVAAQPFTNHGVALKPLSPVHLRAARDVASGDTVFSATRRTRMPTRFGGDLGDACPLGETTEAYRWRLYTDGTGATVLRELGDSTSPTVTYTAAQRTADGLALTATFHVGVVMLSETVGEGYRLLDAA